MNPIFWLLIYAVLASLVVFLSIKLANYVDLLDKKTKVSGALLGGILLAGVTSLPELFTSLTGTLLVNDNQLVLGNILGSDFFDIVIFGVVYFLFFKKFVQGKVGKQHYITSIFLALMLITVT
ncbi:MAG: cation transporter, partial [Bacilli bacterium]|nr:cation transporter [Bacilli bacterium]